MTVGKGGISATHPFFFRQTNADRRMTISKHRNMQIKDIYRNLAGWVLATIVSVFSVSCESIRGEVDECGMYLEFIYNHNMEYTDSFDPQIGIVDIFVFDEQGRYLFSRQARRENLEDGKKIFIGDNLSFGQYKILVIGEMYNNFRVSDENGNHFRPGITLLEDVRISLIRQSETVAHEFPPLWVGKNIDIHYKSNRSVYPIYLIKNTNRFNLLLSDSGGKKIMQMDNIAYTFEITSPEGAIYGYDNFPRSKETIIYTPFHLTRGDGSGELSEGKLNTARLIYSEEYDYRLRVRHTSTGEIMWDYDLIELLERTKPHLRPDGSVLPLQEYLDRQSEWHIVFLNKGGTSEDGSDFTPHAIEINGWIIWLQDISV